LSAFGLAPMRSMSRGFATGIDALAQNISLEFR